jgi:hypothetical protein
MCREIVNILHFMAIPGGDFLFHIIRILSASSIVQYMQNFEDLTALSMHFPTYSVVTNSEAPEPECSSPHSQQPASDPYPEQGESTPHSSNQSP